MNIIFLFILLFFIGCSNKQLQIGQKSFDKEDDFIIKALVYENEEDYNKSISIYKFLYKKTRKTIYLEKIVEDLYFAKRYNDLINFVNSHCKDSCSSKIYEYLVFTYLNQNKLDKAKKILYEKLNKKNEFFYSIMSFILIKEKKYDLAVNFLKSLYALNPSKENLLKLTDLLIRLKKYNEALAYLRTHLNEYGCEYNVCIRMADVYKSLYDFENLALIYEKMGKFDKRFYIFALNIYMQTNNFKKAQELIFKHNLDKDYLMFLYDKMKKYKKAAFVALYLYEKSGNLNYLLKYCEYLYYSKPTKKELKDIINKLKYLVKIEPNAYLYNFLGYIEIDNDLNVKEGIEYVKKALEIDPSNEEYMDSLAWGFYKLGKCKDAYEIIKNVKLKDKEIEYHKKMIKKCLKERNDIRKDNKKDKRGFRTKKIKNKNR